MAGAMLWLPWAANAGPALAAEPVSLTLDGSVAMAQQNAIAVAKAGLNKDVTGALLMQSHAQFLPNLTTTVAGGYAVGKSYLTTQLPTTVKGTDYGAGLQLASSLNLFNGFADQASLKASLQRDSAAQWSLDRAKQQIAIDVAQAFLQVVLDQDLVVIAQKNLEVSRGRERLLAEQARVGAKDLATLYQQQAQTSEGETAVITSTNRWHDDEIRLTRRLRLDPGLPVTLVRPQLDKPSGRYAGQAVDALVHVATEERKDLRAATGIASAADYAVTVARGGYYPRLDFAVTANSTSRTLATHWLNGVDQMPQVRQDPLATQLKDHWLYTLGLTMSWAVFDREVVRTQVEQASAAAKAAALDREDLLLQVEGEVRQATIDYQSAERRLESSNKGLFAAEKAYESVGGRYGVGVASFLDLTTAQSQLVQAQASRAQAQIDVFLQARLLDHYVGTAP